jgi:hypothetical protein
MSNAEILLADYIKPLNSMEEVFLLVNLSTKCNSAFEIEFITETFNSLFTCSYDSYTLKIAIGKFSRLLKIQEKLLLLDVKLQIHHEVVSIPVVKCIVCNDTIKLKTEKSSKLTIGMKGFEYKKFLSGFCEKCKTSYYLDCFEKDEKKFWYNNISNLNYISTSSQKAFEVRFLEWFHINMVRNTASFSGFSEAFNEFYFHESTDFVSFFFNLL